ncbi:serine hydrolase domain-containing protein [Sphingomonas bacterium]|uniref:serine hydrolase domain-containing protein n=1 Tax=Sphingomonas bacterium TaxID=1895847 RepID=UPI0015758434|nr:serine hydrolase domain-containing protein [Sphingomonas bacterium]
MIVALALAAAAVAARVDSVAAQAKLSGEILVARGDSVLLDKGYGAVAPDGRVMHKAGERWRLASVTKQVVATLVMRRVAAGGFGLDAPARGAISYRQLLTHHSGLPNPDATPDTGGIPAFYTKPKPDLAYCTAKPIAAPGGAFSYNNCDYLLLGAALGPRLAWPGGMAMARPGEIGVPGYVGGKPEPRLSLASFGAAGGLMGTARALFRFDRDLMTGKLLPPSALAELWKPEGGRSYQALGQWVFPGQLKGCGAAKRIVQRDGEIGGVQTRNYILPDDDLVVMVFTNRGSDDFSFGEIWQGKGFAYDLLSAVACG